MTKIWVGIAVVALLLSGCSTGRVIGTHELVAQYKKGPPPCLPRSQRGTLYASYDARDCMEQEAQWGIAMRNKIAKSRKRDFASAPACARSISLAPRAYEVLGLNPEDKEAVIKVLVDIGDWFSGRIDIPDDCLPEICEWTQERFLPSNAIYCSSAATFQPRADGPIEHGLLVGTAAALFSNRMKD